MIFSNTSQDFSCIIISFEPLLEHSNTCLLLMKRHGAPVRMFNAACTEDLPPKVNTWNIAVSFINYNKCDGIVSHSRYKVRPALWGCHWLDTSGDTADDDSTACLVEQPRPCRTLEHNSTTTLFQNDSNLTIINKVKKNKKLLSTGHPHIWEKLNLIGLSDDLWDWRTIKLIVS